MKECEKVKENLSAYIDEMLDETEKEQILLHLQSCTSCAEEYEFLKAISETAKDMPELSVSHKLHQSIMDHVMQEAKAPKSVKFSFRKKASRFAAFAAVLVISLISLQSLPKHPEPTPDIVTEDQQNTAENEGAAIANEKVRQAEIFVPSEYGAQNEVPATPQATDAAKQRTETVNGAYEDSVQKAEDSLTASASLDLSDQSSEETKPIPTSKPGKGSGSAGGSSAGIKTKETAEYLFTEAAAIEAKNILADYPKTEDGYAVPYAEYQALSERLSALSGYIESSVFPENESISIVYICILSE